MLNVVTLWNTVYLDRAVDALRDPDQPDPDDED